MRGRTTVAVEFVVASVPALDLSWVQTLLLAMAPISAILLPVFASARPVPKIGQFNVAAIAAPPAELG